MGKRTDLRRSLKSPKKKREKGQKKTEIKSERLRREVEARAVSLMYRFILTQPGLKEGYPRRRLHLRSKL